MIRPRLVHLTTTDMSLDWLLGPQLVAFGDAGFEVIGASAPGPHVAHLADMGIAHVPLRHATRSVALQHDLAALFELTRLFTRLAPAIVHTHNPKPGVYGRLAARAAGVPAVVNTQHGLYATADDRLAKRAVVYGLERVAATCSDAELVQNPEDLETLARLGVPRTKLTLLGNGVDLERFDPDRVGARAGRDRRRELGLDDDEFVVGVVGRLVWEKGYREVFDAARSLRTTHPKVRVVVIGPADDDKEDAVDEPTRRQVTEDAGVVFCGRRDDLPELYAAMDCYVLASYREGFPRSAMEAAAMGLPVITTDVRGCREIVEPGTTGTLVAVRDPAALARAVAELADDPDRVRAYGRQARRRAKAEFDQQRVIDRTLATYDRLLARRAAPSSQ